MFFKKSFFRDILKLVFFYKVAIGFEPNCVTNGNKSSWTQSNQISFLSRNRPIESNPPLFRNFPRQLRCQWNIVFSLVFIVQLWQPFLFCRCRRSIKTFETSAYIWNHIFHQELRDPATDFSPTSAGNPQNSLVLYPAAIFKSIVTIQLFFVISRAHDGLDISQLSR